MKGEEFKSHMLMWFFALAGTGLAFMFFPEKYVAISGSYRLVLVAIVFLFWLRYLASMIYVRASLLMSPVSMPVIIKRGIYAKVIHPFCVNIIALSFLAFLIFLDMRILISAIWISATVIFWIRVIEESMFIPKEKSVDDEAAG